MAINNNFTALTKLVTHIKNPNRQFGVMLEEVPCDIGRSYQGYKRGGIIEGAEKMRRELMGATVWLFGIPVFKFLGDKGFEKLFHVPMKVDFSNAEEGVDAIKNTIRYIFNDENPNNLDVSEISQKYKEKFKDFAGENIEEMAKKVSTGKKITATVAVILNCLMMGIVLPKINQKITKNKLKKQMEKNYAPKFASMDEFRQSNKTNNNISFTGFFKNIADDVRKHGFSYTVGYNTENNNTFRLISTDIPMIAGRVATSRNKYEGFENFFMDTASIFFYNFCSGAVQKGLRKMTGIKDVSPQIPDIMPNVVEIISNMDKEDLTNTFNAINTKENIKNLQEVLPENIIKTIYQAGTFGKYGKINKFVKTSDLKEIDNSVIDFLKYIKAGQNETMPLFKDGAANIELIKKMASRVNKTNAGFLGLGLISSVVGLAFIVPKTTFWITKKLTGRNEFTGIANYDDKKKKNELKA